MTHRAITNMGKLLENYAEENASLLPGRIPNYKRDDIKLLPSSRSKKVFCINIRMYVHNNLNCKLIGIINTKYLILLLTILYIHNCVLIGTIYIKPFVFLLQTTCINIHQQNNHYKLLYSRLLLRGPNICKICEHHLHSQK